MSTAHVDKEKLTRGAVDKRQALVEAARTLFTTVGYEATTIADIARMAGVAVGTVYLYFKNKPEILIAAKGDWDAELVQAITSPELQAVPHNLRARPLIEATFALCSRHTEMVQLMALQAELVGQLYEKDGGYIQHVVKQFLDEGISFGLLREVDTEIAAVIAYGMVEYSLRKCFEQDGGKNQARHIDVLVDALEHWLVPAPLRKRTDAKDA